MSLNVNTGDTVVRELHGAGVVTKDLIDIEHVANDGTIYADGADMDYNKRSQYAYDGKTGRSCSSYVPGFYSVIVRVATKEDIEELTETE